MDNREERYSVFYRDQIVDALNKQQFFDDVIDLVGNGDVESIYVYVSQNGLTLFKMSPYKQDVSYIMVNDRFTKLVDGIYNVIYDFARFLSYEQIERILNINKDRFPSRYLEIIDEDEDRGYIPMLVYRKYEEDNFHVMKPDYTGKIPLSSKIVESLLDASEYDDVETLLKDHEDTVYLSQ